MYRHGLGTQETERSRRSRIVDTINMKMLTDDDYTTREKASSSVGFRCISSTGIGATNKALQLTHSSSACPPALLLHKCSSSAVRGSSLLLVALARFSRMRYCYSSAAANFYTLATANLSSFFWHICFVFEQAL